MYLEKMARKAAKHLDKHGPQRIPASSIEAEVCTGGELKIDVMPGVFFIEPIEDLVKAALDDEPNEFEKERLDVLEADLKKAIDQINDRRRVDEKIRAQSPPAPQCDMCKGTGITTVVTSPPHIAPVKTKEVQCPNGCNAQAVRETLQTSRDIMMMESARIFEAARNPAMPPGWRDWKPSEGN